MTERCSNRLDKVISRTAVVAIQNLQNRMLPMNAKEMQALNAAVKSVIQRDLDGADNAINGRLPLSDAWNKAYHLSVAATGEQKKAAKALLHELDDTPTGASVSADMLANAMLPGIASVAREMYADSQNGNGCTMRAVKRTQRRR